MEDDEEQQTRILRAGPNLAIGFALLDKFLKKKIPPYTSSFDRVEHENSRLKSRLFCIWRLLAWSKKQFYLGNSGSALVAWEMSFGPGAF